MATSLAASSAPGATGVVLLLPKKRLPEPQTCCAFADTWPLSGAGGASDNQVAAIYAIHAQQKQLLPGAQVP